MLRHLAPQPRGRRHDLQHSSGYLLPRRVGTRRRKYHQPLVRPLLPHHHLRRQDCIDGQGSQYLHRGRADGRPGARQLCPDKRGQQGSEDPSGALHITGVGEQADIAESGGPGTYIARLQRALQRCGVAESDLVERLVLEGRRGDVSKGLPFSATRYEPARRSPWRRTFFGGTPQESPAFQAEPKAPATDGSDGRARRRPGKRPR